MPLPTPLSWQRAVVASGLLLCVPAALVGFLCTNQYEIKLQQIALYLASALAAVGLISWWFSTPWLGRRGNTPALICLGAGLLIVAAIGWNRQYMSYVQSSDYTKDAFRPTLHKLHTPAYGQCPHLAWPEGSPQHRAKHTWVHFDWPHWPEQKSIYFSIAALALTAGLMLALYLAAGRCKWLSLWRWMGALMVLQIAMTLCIAGADPTRRLVDDDKGRLTDPYFASYAQFFGDLDNDPDRPPMPHQTLAILRQWTTLMPHLSAFDKHYPPGIVVLLNWCANWGRPLWAKWIVMLGTSLTLLGLAGLCWEWGLRGRALALPLILFASCPGAVNFPTISPVALVMPLGALALWLWVGALRRGNRNWALAAGAAFALCGLYNLTLSLELGLIALALLLGIAAGQCRLALALRTALWAAGAFVAALVLLDVMTGFNFWTCVQQGLASRRDPHRFDTANAAGFLGRYLLRSSGNVLAYLLMSGIALSVLALAGGARLLRRSQRQAWTPLAAALAVVILLAGFAALYNLETERIWLILTPVLAALAGAELHLRGQNEGQTTVVLVVLLCLATTIAQSVLFVPYL